MLAAIQRGNQGQKSHDSRCHSALVTPLQLGPHSSEEASGAPEESEVRAVTIDPGDMGRRLRARRVALHLSVSELARQARIDPGFLQYLEDQAAVSVDSATLFRLAEALGTSAQALLGGGVDHPPGRAHRSPATQLIFLDAGECRRLVGTRGVGRVVFNEGRGPVALPVNYAIHVNDVVFRTTRQSTLSSVVGQAAGFQVDRIDDDLSQGWSVLFTGEASEVTDQSELEQLQGLPPEPWADGVRDVYIRITPTAITGRRIGPSMERPKLDEPLDAEP